MPTRVGWVQREMQPMPHFVLYDEQANFIGRAKHVMLAPGHGPLSFPPVLAKARKDPKTADRIVQAYEPKQYAARRPLHRPRRRDRVGQRVGEHPRRRRRGAGADPQPAARDSGPQRAPLPVRVDRDRRVRVAAVRAADPVPRRGAAGHAARPQAVDHAKSKRGSATTGSTRSSARSPRSSRGRRG